MSKIEGNNQWELLNAFADSTQDGIQIADINGNIVYMNEAAKSRLGVDLKQAVHVSDFEPLFNEPGIWETHLNEIRENGVLIIRSTNINQTTDKLIPVEVTVYMRTIKNLEYVFAVTRDITALQEQEEKLEIRERMLLAISEATSELLYNNNFLNAVAAVLEIIGEAVKVDRTYLFTRNLDEGGEEVVSQRCEWNSGDAEPQIDNPELQNVPITLFDDFLEMMEANTPFQSIVDQLPEESALREILASQGIVSILIIPVFYKGQFWGFIGYDECTYKRVWSEVELSILQTLSNNMTSALERINYQQQIENLAEFPLENPAPVVRIDIDGQLLFQNKVEKISMHQFRRLKQNEELSFQQLLNLIASDVQAEKQIQYYEIQAGENEYYSITAKEVENKSYINLYFSDISKLKETEKQLKQTQSIVEQIINNMDDVIWSASYPEYNALFISPSTEKLYGIPSAAFYKNTQVWLDPIIEEDRHLIDQIFENIQTKGESDCTYRIQLPSNDIKWVRNRTKVMFDSDTKEPIRIDGYIVDITDQKLNQELTEKARLLAEESNAAKEEFISNMSHEIRTPLNAILGLSRQLLENAVERETRHTLHNIVQSGNHLQSLIENVLDFSKITAGQFEINPTRTNLHTEITSVHQMLEGMAKEKGLGYKQSIDPQLDQFVELDKRRFKQILINLLSNALKFTDEGFVGLKANLSPCKTKVEFIVKDTGIGMSEAFISKIFDKFAQEDGSHERKVQGSGLGMAITKKIVDLLEGEIHIKSLQGFGTEIKISIPFKPCSPIDRHSMELISDLSTLREKQILIVEDNALNAIVVRNTLNKFGIHSEVAQHGLEAIEAIKKQHFDLILMDLQMPVMGGIMATQILRKEMQIKLPIVGLSANALSSSKTECMEAGMNDYITKPFEEERLLEVLAKLLIVPDTARKPYDLSRYQTSAEDNPEFLKEIVSIFVDLIPGQVQEMKVAAEKDDYAAIKRVAHKIKPNLLMFGVENGKDNIMFLNYFEESDAGQIGELDKRISELEQTVQLVCEELYRDYLEF
jgi:PAS domain S-box-containing protein